MLYSIVVVLPYFDMNHPWVHMCPTILNPILPAPHPIPLGCPRAPALSTLLHALNLRWPSILHMVIYMFQRYSLISSHPCLLLHSPKVCSLYLCLFCCLACRVVIQSVQFSCGLYCIALALAKTMTRRLQVLRMKDSLVVIR